ncbi:tRNA (adenosine(37)-N6)-dimethylallyltransferase MiaA [Herpetosiphon geysericola]|uniref:tRNA dimethylallyltransferase n=1 Tax=Herpetosiphon geysericola TaxID=70996 RepID=A0A0P6Y859_9CHLR|nr:tRNA (adenosine(37)-N6)-dimethylallyltransferase MiaA [Herpetosiphon geysericola]KPL85144.1 tRNA delta(2)-isopentenylpyrophosphate transferase [Herpetosiphon geysericola]
MQASQPLIIAIVGATAVGKTAFSLDLAQALNGEIVSVDSRLVYRGMDLGTAKPTPAEQALVKHHLIDVVKPDQDYSLATYQAAAYAAIASIVQRAKLPILVGGTGQYMAALLEGWSIPEVAPNYELRARYEQQAALEGHAALHQQLQAIDPEAAATIDATNVRRVIRALEVFAVTGQQISQLQRRQPPAYRILTLDLERPRDELYARIDQRVEIMVQQGLIAEVWGLIRQGYGWELPAMSGLGYAEFRPLWQGQQSATACISQLKFNTHRFARKQGAWFRRLPNRVSLDARHPNLLQQVQMLLAAMPAPEAIHIDH